MNTQFKVAGACFVLLCMVAGMASAKPAAPAYDAALLKETDAFLKAMDKVLVTKGDGLDLKRRADHSRWGQDIKKRSAVFVGTGTDREQFESPYRPCQMAVHHAVEIWSSRMSFDSRPTKLNHDFIERYQREYQTELKECRAAKR
jgi:hypothetical protein